MKTAALILLAASLITGCVSTPGYDQYLAAETARSNQASKGLDNLAILARDSTDPTVRVAALLVLTNAMNKPQAAIAKPTNPLMELADKGLSAYSTWSNTLTTVLGMNRSTTALDPGLVEATLNILTPNTK